jgi:copper(I)-binding protein
LRHCAALFALLALFVSGGVAAQAPSLSAQDAWIRATPGVDVAAVYLTLHNGGTHPVTIVGVSSPAAGQAMIHETKLTKGTSSMRPHERLTVAPGATVHLEPDGLHIMLTMLTRTLAPDDEVALLLKLADGSTLTVRARVRPLSQE